MANEVEEIPDDFFNDLADGSDEEIIIEENPQDDEQMKRCVAEITKLQRQIERRKELITETERSHEVALSSSSNKLRKGHQRRSRSRSRSRNDRSSRRDKPGHSRSERKRSRSRHRSRSPGNFRHRARRSRSGSPRGKRSSSMHKNLSFLEELAQTFASRGQEFPEKDLLLQQNAAGIAMSQMVHTQPMHQHAAFTQISDSMNAAGLIQHTQPGFSGQANMFYGVNPASMMAAGPSGQNQFPVSNGQQSMLLMDTNAHALNDIKPSFQPNPIHTHYQKGIIERCDEAIKLIRAKYNKVPVMKFQYIRASILAANTPTDTKTTNQSPFQTQTALNTTFKISAAQNDIPKAVVGVKHLPKRVKDVAIALGIKSSFLFEKLRTKELTAQLSDAIQENIIVPPIQIKQEFPTATAITATIATFTQPIVQPIVTPKPPPPPTPKCDSGTQTQKADCDTCVKRSKVITVNKQTQHFQRVCSIGVQTNEKDYREPIVEQLARMTAAQLVAIKDFANIITEPRPQNAAELFKLKERMMDTYNLSQRDADAVRTAEENRLDDVNYIEQLRFRSNDIYSNENSRDFERSIANSPAPRYNDNAARMPNFGNFDGNHDDRRMPIDNDLDPRMDPRMFDEIRERDRDYQRMLRDREEQEHQEMLEMERNRERALEREQRMYEEEQRRIAETDRRRYDQDSHYRPAQSQQPQPEPYRFQEDIRMQDMEDRDRAFNRNVPNRRGRGAFVRGGRRR